MAESDTDNSSTSQPGPAAEILLNDPVIDLTNPEATWDHVKRDLNPFERLSQQETRRLMVRILCELVAFGEFEDDDQPVGARPAAGVPVGSQSSASSS